MQTAYRMLCSYQPSGPRPSKRAHEDESCFSNTVPSPFRTRIHQLNQTHHTITNTEWHSTYQLARPNHILPFQSNVACHESVRSCIALPALHFGVGAGEESTSRKDMEHVFACGRQDCSALLESGEGLYRCGGVRINMLAWLVYRRDGMGEARGAVVWVL